MITNIDTTKRQILIMKFVAWKLDEGSLYMLIFNWSYFTLDHSKIVLYKGW